MEHIFRHKSLLANNLMGSIEGRNCRGSPLLDDIRQMVGGVEVSLICNTTARNVESGSLADCCQPTLGDTIRLYLNDSKNISFRFIYFILYSKNISIVNAYYLTTTHIVCSVSGVERRLST